MDLHNIVSGAIGSINPFITVQYLQSTGAATNPDGTLTPVFAAPVSMSVQKQELSFKDLQHVEGLGLQGIFCSVYLEGQAYGSDRLTAQGGDKFIIAGQTWLVVAVPEQWPWWTKVILCLQVNP